MARILYGVSGEGAGHATRSKVIIEHLLKKHEVVIVCGGKAYDYLSKFYSNVVKIFGLRIIYKRNKISNLDTIAFTIKNYHALVQDNIRKISSLIVDFKPNLIINDYEYLTNWASGKFKVPCISIDNNHLIDKCKVVISPAEIKSYLSTKLLAATVGSNSKYYIILSFVKVKRKHKNVFLFPPVIRPEILRLKPRIGDYILVYQTSDSNKVLLKTLKKIDEKFIVYGFNKSKREKNIIFRKFNEGIFFRDLSNCKAVITNGGFSLISEALELRKPILSVPVRSHYEQFCNGYYLQKRGYGYYCKNATKKKILGFITNLESYRKNLNRIKRKGNKKLFKKLDSLIFRLTK